MYMYVIMAAVNAITDEIRPSLSRNDLLVDINEKHDRNIMKIKACGKCIRANERINTVIKGIKRVRGISRTPSKRRRKINIINPRDCGTNQPKFCERYTVA